MNRKALGIAFLSGVLLCGLGCGVAFAQYSKMEYAGERIIGGENIVKETLEAELESEGKILIPSYYTTSHSRYGTTLETDENIPKNKIIFDIEYNPERFAPAVERHTQYEDILYGTEVVNEYGEVIDYREEYKTDPEKVIGEVYELGRPKYYDDVKDFFEVKDMVLSDIKNGKLGNYRVEYIESITVRVNPANADRVEFYY